MGNTKCTLDQVLAAIEGSHGIKIAIAKRLGVCRQTVTRYLEKWSTAQKAYDAEIEGATFAVIGLVALLLALALP